MAKGRDVLLRAVIAVLALVGLSANGHAQLNDSCTVSAFNRTAPVQVDGVWVLPNVPANLGQVRVRATCVENGTLRFGQSGLITIPASGVVTVDQIDFSAPVAIPVSLSLSAPSILLTAAGQTVQLAALASYPDGSTGDVTIADKGTNYRSSNPAIASVDASGLVIARASGVALLSAVNEGALGMLRIQVVASGDSDGDGLPDDWELAHGLDPNNPVDALADPDGDGLSTIDEYRLGTDPFKADTDGDGLSDGDEVNLYHTNPLLVDTDGDGLWDGLEVRTGSDPLDPSSFNLGAALQSIEVTPAVSVIVFNTVIGEASRQLRVTGHLIDGHTLDVTSSRYGTGFASSDPLIAGFGSDDGRVFAGQDGLATITASNHGFSSTAQVRIETFAPRALSFVHIPGFANSVTVAGNYAYVAAGATGLQVVDVTDLMHPFVAGAVDTPGNANDVRVVGSLAYVADGPQGLQVVDVSGPTAPRIVGHVLTVGAATAVAVAGGIAYVADEQGLSVLDVSRPTRTVLLGSVQTPGRARGVEVNGTLAVVATSDTGVQTVDVSDPANPFLAGSTATRPDGTSSAASVAVRGDLAVVADGADATLGGLAMIDLRSPENIVVTGATSSQYGLTGVALDHGFALASDYLFTNAVPIFDIGSIGSGAPQIRGIVDFSQAPSYRDDQGNGVAARDGVVFLAATRCCDVVDNGVTSDSILHIGRYAIFEDDAGIPPAVTVTAPAAGATAGERTRLTVRAEASDDVRVDAVQLLVNGSVVSTLYSPPYEVSLTVPSGVSELRLGAIATDGGGNQTVADEVRVTVTANAAPVAALLAPVPGQTVIEGTNLVLAAEASDDNAVTRVDFFVNGSLVDTVLDPPYRSDYFVPLGTPQVAVSATAYDDLGPSPAAAPSVLVVQPDAPPFAALVSPGAGTGVEEDSTVTLVAGVADDVGVTAVQFLVNGAVVRTLFAPPFQIDVTAPAAGSSWLVQIVASDIRGHATASPVMAIPVLSDPGTTVVGRVQTADGQPVAGATVDVLAAQETVTAVTAGDGSFAVAGIRTNRGNLSLRVLGRVNGCGVTAALGPLSPVPGLPTEVGTLIAASPASRTTTVAGVVVDANGNAVAGTVVKVFSEDLAVLAQVRSGADGSFAVPDLAVRAWGVNAVAVATLGGTELHGSASLRNPDVSPGAVTDLGSVVLASPAGTVSQRNNVVGRVVDATGAPVANAPVLVRAGGDLFASRTAADGSFAIDVPVVDGFGDTFQIGTGAVVDCLFYIGPLFAAYEFDSSGTTDTGTLMLQLDPGPPPNV